jgi:2'-5' RNA ligase
MAEARPDSKRLFLAVDMPDDIRAKISSISSALKTSGVSVVSQQNMHITLLFLGDVKSGNIPSLASALGRVRFKSFDIGMRGFGTFSASRPRVVFAEVEKGGDALEKLHSDIFAGVNGLDGISLPDGEEAGFSAHVTVARIRHAGDGVKSLLDGFLEENKHTYLGSFNACSFVLKSSRLTGSGPVYEDIVAFSAAP